MPFGGDFFVDVQNCRASLVVARAGASGFYIDRPNIDLTEDEHEVLVEQVERAGGMINISGWYPLVAPDNLPESIIEEKAGRRAGEAWSRRRKVKRCLLGLTPCSERLNFFRDLPEPVPSLPLPVLLRWSLPLQCAR